jgi:hypothetical protein
MDDTINQSMLIAIGLIVTAIVLSVIMMIISIGNSGRQWVQDGANSALFARVEAEIIEINNYGGPIPVASLIQFLDKSAGIVHQVRTVNNITFTGDWQNWNMAQPIGGATYAFMDPNPLQAGTYHAQRIFLNEQFRQEDGSVADGLFIDNRTFPLHRGLEGLIGRKLNVFIAQDATMNFIMYVAPAGG